MEFLTLIEKRRSTRSYMEGVQVPAEDIAKIITAAQQAPTWKNSQTGRYYVALGEEAFAAAYDALPEFNQNNVKNCGALIVTTFETKRSGFNRDGSTANELGDQWGAYDLGLQNAYLVLAAQDLGYDSLIMGLRDADRLRELFAIPESQQIVSVISLGKRADEPLILKRKDLDAICVVK